MTKVSYTIEGTLVAETTIGRDPLGLRSYVFICTTCGWEWARIACEPCDAWEAQSRPCRFHRPLGVRDWSAHPGTLTTSTSEDRPVWDQAIALRNLPRKVLQWELEREIEFYEKGHK